MGTFKSGPALVKNHKGCLKVVKLHGPARAPRILISSFA